VLAEIGRVDVRRQVRVTVFIIDNSYSTAYEANRVGRTANRQDAPGPGKADRQALIDA